MGLLHKSLTFLLIFLSMTTYAQKIDAQWKSTLNSSIASFKLCEEKSDDGKNLCTTATGESINKIYKIDDFYSKQNGRFMNNTEIINLINSGTKWKLMGYAYEQEVLNKAQEHANANKATIAYYANDDLSGNVAIILPGELIKSGSWGFDVPNSATFFIEEPAKSYADKGLSYAFSRSILPKVMIYGREY